MSSLIPLFPLDAVLLPGAPLPLHIFEPRYKEMVNECLEQRAPFGIVRAQESGTSEIGCTADIIAVPKRYDDGRMDIVTEGRRRFEVLQLDEQRSFTRADVLFFDDDPGKATAEETAEAVRLHGEILALAGAETMIDENDDPLLSFRLAGSLPLDLDFKQDLLGMRSEGQRVKALIAYLQAVVPRLKYALHARQKAGGNGHAR